MRKVIHLENKTTSEHKYYGSLVALWKDNVDFPYHTVKRLDLSEGWENETFKIRLGVLLTPSDVEAGRVDYEWTTEEIDTESGDIIDSSFYNKLSDISKGDFESNDVGLVRNEGNEVDGLEDRFWAYVKDGKLPEYFSDGRGQEVGIKVPKKFHIELAAYLKNHIA